jgi:hypothetical protein
MRGEVKTVLIFCFSVIYNQCFFSEALIYSDTQLAISIKIAILLFVVGQEF